MHCCHQEDRDVIMVSSFLDVPETEFDTEGDGGPCCPTSSHLVSHCHVQTICGLLGNFSEAALCPCPLPAAISQV